VLYRLSTVIYKVVIIRVYNGLSIVCVSFLEMHDIKIADITLAEFVPGLQLGC
jgi:hypothetical protein